MSKSQSLLTSRVGICSGEREARGKATVRDVRRLVECWVRSCCPGEHSTRAHDPGCWLPSTAPLSCLDATHLLHGILVQLHAGGDLQAGARVNGREVKAGERQKQQWHTLRQQQQQAGWCIGGSSRSAHTFVPPPPKKRFGTRNRRTPTHLGVAAAAQGAGVGPRECTLVAPHVEHSAQLVVVVNLTGGRPGRSNRHVGWAGATGGGGGKRTAAMGSPAARLCKHGAHTNTRPAARAHLPGHAGGQGLSRQVEAGLQLQRVGWGGGGGGGELIGRVRSLGRGAWQTRHMPEHVVAGAAAACGRHCTHGTGASGTAPVQQRLTSMSSLR